MKEQRHFSPRDVTVIKDSTCPPLPDKLRISNIMWLIAGGIKRKGLYGKRGWGIWKSGKGDVSPENPCGGRKI
jgi:hypothetical protein